MTGLPPDVRERAARAAFEHSWRISPYPGWDDLPEEWREIQRAEVDAVAEVLAAEQSDEIPHWRTGELIRRINTVCAQRDQLDAENLLLREQASAMAEDLELLRAERELYRTEGLRIQADRDALKARVAELSTALVEIDDLADTLSTVGLRVIACKALSATPAEGEFDSNDLRVSYYYEAGATALSEFMCGVNITHVPTGITISHHSERSQLQNKVRCYEDLKRRLAGLAPSERGATPTESEAP